MKHTVFAAVALLPLLCCRRSLPRPTPPRAGCILCSGLIRSMPRCSRCRYDPLVTRNGNGVTIYPPLTGTTAIPDLNAPALHVWPNDGTRWSSGSGPPLGLLFARSWSPEPESRDADSPRMPAPLAPVPTLD